MRISGGLARGIPLAVVKGDRVRPATDGLRQAVFSSLGERVRGAWVVDLFAGSGAYGLEALSRGAAGGMFVEQASAVVALLRRNLTAVAKSAGVDQTGWTVRAGDAVVTPEPAAGATDLVFVDPPYELVPELGPRIMAGIRAWSRRTDDCLVVFEMPGEFELVAQGWVAVKRIGRGARQPTAVIFRPAGGDN